MRLGSGNDLSHFRDVFPKAFRHELPSQFGIVAALYGHGVVELPPGLLGARLVCCSVGQGYLFRVDKIPAGFVVDACDFMDFVVDDEGLGIETGGKPVHKQGNHVRVGVALRKPNVALQMLEA